MTELAGSTLAMLQTVATAGLVVCLLMAGAFTAVGLVASEERGRRDAVADAERIERISNLLAENETMRAADVRIAQVDPAGAIEPAGPERLAARDDGADTDTQQEDAAREKATAADIEVFEGEADEAAGEALAAAETTGAGSETRAAAETNDASNSPEDVRSLFMPAEPRRLAAAEADAIAAALAGQEGTFTVEVTSAPEAEARLYALQLAGALRGAGVDARGPVTVLTTMQTGGVLVSMDDEASGPGATLLSALQGAGLDALPAEAGSRASDILTPEDTDVRLYVGGRSGPALQKDLPAEATDGPRRADAA